MSRYLRQFSLLILGLLLLGVLAACGDTATSTPPATNPTTPPAPTTGGTAPTTAGTAPTVAGTAPTTAPAAGKLSGSIDFWVYDTATIPGAQAALEALKADFEKTNPGTTINLIPVPKDSFNTKINTAIASGSAPDASYLDQPLVAQFVSDKTIDPVPTGLVDEKSFFEGALNTNRVNGTLYGLPIDQVTVALFYNKDLVPTAPKTWDELIAAAKKAYNPDKQIAGFLVPKGDGYGAWAFPGVVATAGGTMLDEKNKKVTFADQPAVDALTLWKTLLQYSPRTITDSQNSFQTGHTAMMISGPWEITGLKANYPNLKYGVALMPQKTQTASNIGGEDSVVYTSAKNKPLAWAWLKYLTSEKPNVDFSTKVMGSFPVVLADGKGAWLNGDENLGVFMEQMKSAQSRPTQKDWLKINDTLVGKAIENALDNGQDPAAALKDSADKAKTLLGW